MKRKAGFVIPIDVFNSAVLISFNQSDKKLRDLAIKNNADLDQLEIFISASLKYQGLAGKLSDGSILIRINPIEDRYSLMSVIAHESFHAAHYIMEEAGIKFKMDISDEVAAYLIGYISKNIYKKLKM